MGLHFIFHWTGLDHGPDHKAYGTSHAMNVTSPLNGTAALNATAAAVANATAGLLRAALR